MKKKLYYTVEKETEFINEIQECTGFKSIVLYSIDNNIPEAIGHITDIRNEDDSQEIILDYLNDNGFGDDDFEMIQL